VQTKGALNHELTGYLRTRRVMRRPRGANRFKATTMGQLTDIISIRERPPEAEDRAVPGHWKGDLICGTGGSAVATLVERSTRFTQLVRIEKINSETPRRRARHPHRHAARTGATFVDL
jgi:IS30 family transposase